MPFMKKHEYAGSLGILDSEVGLATKVKTALQTDAATDGNSKIIAAGTLYTNPDNANDIGVWLEDVDLTDDAKLPAAVVVAGRLKRDRVAAEVVAKEEAFQKQGLYIVPAAKPAGSDTDHK